jgi:hypothetical protein
MNEAQINLSPEETGLTQVDQAGQMIDKETTPKPIDQIVHEIFDQQGIGVAKIDQLAQPAGTTEITLNTQVGHPQLMELADRLQDALTEHDHPISLAFRTPDNNVTFLAGKRAQEKLAMKTDQNLEAGPTL